MPWNFKLLSWIKLNIMKIIKNGTFKQAVCESGQFVCLQLISCYDALVQTNEMEISVLGKF